MKRSKAWIVPAAMSFFAAASPAAVPNWLRVAASAPLPQYSSKTNAVVLLDEQTITVNESGDVRMNRRLALKILRPEGRDYGLFALPYGKDTRLNYLKGWSLPVGLPENEVKEKSAVETGWSSDVLYSDVRRKMLMVPGADPGTVVGFEYEQQERPFLLQHIWSFQRSLPVRKARLSLQLPAAWEFKSVWRNYRPKDPAVSGNQFTWEIEDVPPLPKESFMPPEDAVAGQMGLSYLATGVNAAKNQANWRDVAAWFAALAATQVRVTPPVARKSQELAGSVSLPWKKVETLAEFVQRQIRYVAIPIGISSHQPHPAGDVLSNGYGDCKDKATLLKALLKAAGIDSYYLLVNSERGSVNPDFASVLNFNHVILAIRQPAGESVPLFSQVSHAVLGTLVLFDPTDPLTPLGLLPDSEQSSYGLLVRDDGGELLRIPLLAPSASRLIRAATLKLESNGTLTGAVNEQRWGDFAAETRAQYRRAEGPAQSQILEGFLSTSLAHFQLNDGTLENLDRTSDLGLTYRFTAPNYGKVTGDYLLLRPRVLGNKSLDLGEKKERHYPLSLSTASVQTDSFDIELPGGYEVYELPRPANAEYPFAQYKSKISLEGKTLHYERQYVARQVEIPQASFDDFWNLQRTISADEQAYVLLKVNTGR
jgi:hypothetical protein